MDQINDQLLHFLQGTSPNAFTQMLRGFTKDFKSWCPFEDHKEDESSLSCYLMNPRIQRLLRLSQRFSVIVKYLSRDLYRHHSLDRSIKALEDPEENYSAEEFEKNLEGFIGIAESIEKSLHGSLKMLSCLECQRLDEAVNCRHANCYLASTVMAASAVEARLNYLLEKKSPTIYKKKFSKATLGELIKVFDPNEYKGREYVKLKALVSQRHQPLLDLVNTYRVLSAHPKTASIDYKIADSILNLSFSFLLDPEVQITDSKILKHK